jgi:O-antigen ligase
MIIPDTHFTGASVSELLRRDRVPFPLLVAAASLALSLAVPFVLPFNSLPVTTFYQEWVAMGLGCVTCIAAVWSKRGETLVVPRSIVLPAGLCLLLLIQALSGKLDCWQVGLLGALYLLWSIAMLCSGAALARSLGVDRFCLLAAWALCAGALFSAAIGLAQLAHWRAGGLIMPMMGPRVHANLAQPNHFADYISLGLFSLCFLYARHKINTVVAVAAGAVLLLAADLSGSRSVWAYLCAAALFALWTHWRARTDQTRTLAHSLVAVLAGMVVVSMLATGLLGQTLFPADAVSHLHTGSERLLDDLSGASHRRHIWSAAWRIFESAPVAGVGFGGFAYGYFLLRGQVTQALPEEIVDHAHNVLLQLLAEFGLPGGILLAVTALAWLTAALRCRASAQQWWMLTLVTVIGLHSLVEYPLWYAYFLGLFALLVGATDHTAWRLTLSRAGRLVIAGTSVIVIWIFASVLVDYRLAENLAIESAANRDNGKVIVEAARASRTSVFGHFIELGISRTIALNQEAVDAKVALNARALHLFPAPDVAYRQSALYALQGDTAAARRMWDLAARAYPGQAVAVRNALAEHVTAGEAALEPLVEYAASRNRGTQ